jgi:hypothetical protein
MVSLYSATNGNGMAAQRKAVEDYLNGGRWKLDEFTEVDSGKRAVAGTCMDNRRATVPSSDKDAVGASAYTRAASKSTSAGSRPRAKPKTGSPESRKLG